MAYVPRTDDNSVVLAYGYKATKDSSDGEDNSDNTQDEPPADKSENTTITKIGKVILKINRQLAANYNIPPAKSLPRKLLTISSRVGSILHPAYGWSSGNR